MFIELVDALRCVAVHADTHLVAAPLEMSDRNIVRGTLGCPICRAEYELVDGVAWFTNTDTRAAESAQPVTEYEALRCAALLDLQGTGGFAVLTGEWGALAPSLLDSVGVHLVLINPPRSVQPAAGLSILVTDGAIPLAPESARALALDRATASAIGLDVAASRVRNSGRLVAPANCELPSNARLLASDDRDLVAEVSHVVTTPISIRRARKGD